MVINFIQKNLLNLVHLNANLRKLATGFEWAEGPVWIHKNNCLLWSDIPNNRIMRWSEQDGVSEFRKPSNHANGNTIDSYGRLVTCEHSAHRVSRTELDGSVITLVDNYLGRKLNSPNDVVIKSDGSIWFTDPPYGILSNREGYQRKSEIGENYVYRFDPDSGDLQVVSEDFDRPNGIAFSPDERKLYISDTGAPAHIRVFKVNSSGSLQTGQDFAVLDNGKSDGFKFDTDGNMWTSANDGVHILSPAGELLGKILVPETVANLCFGGKDRKTLFITATTSLYAICVEATGFFINSD